MFEWKVEDMKLLKEKNALFKDDRNYIFKCEKEVSREEKIEFLDTLHDGKVSYLLNLIARFKDDAASIPKSQYGKFRKNSLKAWIRKNDTRNMVDIRYDCGYFSFNGVKRFLDNDNKTTGFYAYDVHDDLVDEIFHRQLKEYVALENKYFLEHDETSVLKTKFNEKFETLKTTFGVNIILRSNGDILISDGNGKERNITNEELKEMIAKYEQVENLIEKITKETKIVY